MIGTLFAAAGVALDPGHDDVDDHMDGDWGGMMGWGGGWGASAWMVAVLAVVAVVAVVVVLVLGTRGNSSGGGYAGAAGSISPRDMIDRRLAAGDISIEEHRALATELDGGGAAPKRTRGGSK